MLNSRIAERAIRAHCPGSRKDAKNREDTV
jgi:hypothetical protein